ncbi:hypothetical protein [Asticcacaulis sp. EMRT-3]|nr:hypothetical protein [Asticcacaulis sp. EMRT-3]MDI7775647.1 hypothetical protein [Asticcacaulis sp. EMRT-3]
MTDPHIMASPSETPDGVPAPEPENNPSPEPAENPELPSEIPPVSDPEM